MTPTRWRRLQSIVDAALNLPPAERAEYLERTCDGDEALRREAQNLIDSDEQAGDFFEHAIQAGANAAIRAGAACTPVPERIGRYRPLRMLGEGGMGLVYEAEQEHPRRLVALKVIRPTLATSELRRRFEQESDLLGRLQHPGICRIYEAGVADTGQLYFAMELVSGQPLLEYCEANHLDLRAKLTLMVRICDALQHAHQRGIIHRDLKPGNILVDKTGQPKILDFGVARVTDSDTRATRQTDVGQLIGTLAYMSPEQMLADPLELDTRSDVYALGVILYELLAGRLPYKVNREVLLEAVRAVREDEPAPLRSVSTLYRGDIETIAAKALEKDKSRRYSSAAALAGDIERYLNNEPITARPPTTMYQVRKFASRNKPLVVGVACVLLALAAGIVVSTWEAVRADREAATAKAISNFLQNDLLAQASANVQAGSSQKPDPDLKIRTALDRAAARIAGKFHGQPAVEASLRQTIGVTYLDLGLYAQAQPHLQRAVDLRTQALGYAHPDTLSSLHSLALSYRYQGKYAQADELYTKVVNLRRRVLGENDPATLLSMNNLGMVYLYRDKYAEAEKIHARVWEIRKRLLGERHPDTLTSMSNLALAYENEGQYGAAEKLFIDTLKLERAVLGDHHPDTLRTLNHLAVTYNDQGKFVDAQHCLLEALKLRRETQGEQHPDTLVVINNLASAYLDEGDFDKALEMFNHSLSIIRTTLGDEHPDTLRCLINIAVTHRARGEFKQAEELNLKVLTLRRRILGPDHPNTLWALDALARNYLESGAYADAERVYADVIERRHRVLGPRHPRTLESLAFMAQTLVLEGKFTEAEPYAREALAGRQKAETEIWKLYHAKSVAGASLAGQKKHAEADPLLISGYRGLLERQPTMPAEDRKLVVVSRNWLDKLGPGSGDTPLAKLNRAR